MRPHQAPGQDPLARGWTRGGEIYLWVAKGVKAEQEIEWGTLSAMRGAASGAGARGVTRRESNHTSGGEDADDTHDDTLVSE